MFFGMGPEDLHYDEGEEEEEKESAQDDEHCD